MTQRKLLKIYLFKPMSMGFILRAILSSGGFSDQQFYKKRLTALACVCFCLFSVQSFFFSLEYTLLCGLLFGFRE